MYSGSFFAFTFIVFFVLGVLIVGGTEWVAMRIKAHRRRVKRLEQENEKLKRTNSFLLLEIQTKDK